MSPHDFRRLVQSGLGQLDQAMEQLRHCLGPLPSAAAVDAAAAEAALRAAVAAAAEVQQLVRRTAAEAGLGPPDWADRAGLEAAVTAVAERLELQEAPRQRLRRMAAELAGGTVAHRRPGRQA